MRYAIISDIHGNLEALQAVLADAGEVSQVWCLGDVVGYGPDPNECIRLLRSYEHVCVAGNHDQGAIGRLELREFNADARDAAIWTADQLTSASRVYLDTRPRRESANDFTLVHGSPRDPIWEYLVDGGPNSAAKANMDYFSTLCCLVGHTHVPTVFIDQPSLASCKVLHPDAGEIVRIEESRLIINPGAVGQPRDGDPRAAYIIFEGDQMTLQYRRVSYPLEQTQEKMRRIGLPHRLISRLALGW